MRNSDESGVGGGVALVDELTQNTSVTSALATAAFQSGQVMVKSELVGLFLDWVNNTRDPLSTSYIDEFSWFISKRAQALIDQWLVNNKWAALEPRSPAGTGVVIITRERVNHVLDSRTNKDAVSPPGVVELLGQLFAHGSPKYAPNPRYAGQLVMFDPTYTANNPAAKGEAPCAVLVPSGESGAHLKLMTAYWIKPIRIADLNAKALSKGGNSKK